MITYRKAQGLLVVSRQEGAVVGKLDDFQFDLTSHRIYGYRIKGTKMFSKSGGVRAEALDQVGRDVVFIRSEEDVDWQHTSRNSEQDRAWASQYRGRKVMDRRGISLGEVVDFVFDPFRDSVLGLMLDAERLVPLNDQVATGPAAIIVDSTGVIERVETRSDGGEGGDWWSRLLALRDGDPEDAEE